MQNTHAALLAALIVLVVGDIVLALVAGPTTVTVIPLGIVALARLVAEWHRSRDPDGAKLTNVSNLRGGRSGHPVKPSALRLLEGNPGKRKIVPEPAAAPGDCEPPPELSEAARRVWETLAPELEGVGLLAPRYTGQFAMFCEAFAAWRRSADLVALAGPLVMRGDVLVSNPASREFARFGYLSRALGADFGLSPSAVTGLGRAMAEQLEPGQRSPSRLLG